MQPRSYTRMGPAIRHATARLRRHAARTRFLVVVSDGYPQDRDYGPVRGDAAYGVADTAKALEEAHRHGIVTFCITVDPAGHDYLQVMCPGDRYAVIDDVSALPAALPKLYRALDAQAGAGGRRRAGAGLAMGQAGHGGTSIDNG
jgi:nitric oxide reductase NorD protein